MNQPEAAASQQHGGTATVFDAEWNELDRGPINEVMDRLTTAAKYVRRTGTSEVVGVVVSGRLCEPGPGAAEGVQLVPPVGKYASLTTPPGADPVNYLGRGA